MIWCRMHAGRKRAVLAIADEELMGMSFEEGEFVLSVNSFFKGELVREDEAAAMLKDAEIINAVGRKAVAVVLEAGLSDGGTVKRVGGVPHVQVVKINI